MECDVFQTAKLVASFFGGNQCVINRAHGGKPMPCTQPLSIQSKPSVTTAELKPNRMFTPAESINPAAMNVRALARSPTNPFASLDTP